MTDLKTARVAADALAALAEPTRLRLVLELRAGPLPVGELARRIGAEVVNASHHLNWLRAAGLVAYRKRGKFRDYSLADRFSVEAGTLWLDLGWCRVAFPAGAGGATDAA